MSHISRPLSLSGRFQRVTALRLSLRIALGELGALGPGKMPLLEGIERTGSIAGAARAMRMSYRRAWLLVAELNRCFRSPLVATAPGDRHGASLTPLGRDVLRRYREVEARAQAACDREMAGLAKELAISEQS
jgi:molybdate transport system regulatory protein